VLRGVARTAVVAGTASAVAGGVHHRQDKRWAAQDQQAYDQQQAAYDAGQAAAVAPPAPPPVAPAPAAPAANQLDQLERLAKLKEQGVLTDAEFAAEKAKILAG
jgi:hypothetical protein